MTLFKTTIIAFGLVLSTSVINAQNITIKTGGQSKTLQKKGSDAINFVSNGDNYFITTTFEAAMMNYYLECFSSSGSILAQTKLEIPVGVFNNSYSIGDVVSLGNSAYALVEHLDKPSGKNSFLARSLSNSGKIASTEVEIMSFPFEKTMNSGFNHAAVSPDNSILVAVGEYPYVKDQSAKLKIALFDKELKSKSESTISIPGEDTKNKNITVTVANDGTVYLIKRTMTKNGEIALTVYQFSASKPSDLKSYSIEMAAPLQFNNYNYTVNTNNELILSGTYYERKTVTVGEKMAVGVFFFTNKGMTEKSFSTFPLDKPVENLTARKVLVNGNTIFLTAEQYKEERITPPASATGAAALDYSYNHSHKSEYVIAMDLDGKKKFELSMAKDFTARDHNKQYLSAYFICNDKLTVIYNDQTNKYTGESNYSSLVPILVQISNDGLMQSPVVFKDNLKLPYNFILHPSTSVQNTKNELTFLLRNSENSQYLNLKID